MNNFRSFLKEFIYSRGLFRLFLIGSVLLFLFLVVWLLTRGAGPTPSVPPEKTTTVSPTLLTPIISPVISSAANGAEMIAGGVPIEQWNSLPKEVKVFDVVPASNPDLSNWPKKFGFAGEGRYLGLGESIWAEEDKIFRLDKENRSFTYQRLRGTESGRVSLERLRADAIATAKEAGLGPFETFTITRTEFLLTQPPILVPVDRFDQATRVSFYLTPIINGLSLISSEIITEPVEVTYGRSGDLLEFTYHFLDFTIKEPKVYKLKNPQRALKELADGKGVLTSIGGTQAGIPILSQQLLSNVQLAYLYPKAGQKQLLPVLVFTGRAADKEAGRSLPVTVLLWAVGE